MGYVLSKELMKFIFSSFVLFGLVIGLVLIVSLQFDETIDSSEVEMYNVYRVYKDCNECEHDYCVNKENCETVVKCKTYGYVDKVEVCL